MEKFGELPNSRELEYIDSISHEFSEHDEMIEDKIIRDSLDDTERAFALLGIDPEVQGMPSSLHLVQACLGNAVIYNQLSEESKRNASISVVVDHAFTLVENPVLQVRKLEFYKAIVAVEIEKNIGRELSPQELDYLGSTIILGSEYAKCFPGLEITSTACMAELENALRDMFELSETDGDLSALLRAYENDHIPEDLEFESEAEKQDALKRGIELLEQVKKQWQAQQN